MRLEELFDTLTQRIERDCEEIRASAEREAHGILEEAEAQASRTRQERLDERRAEGAARLAAARDRADAESSIDQAAMRHAVANEVLDRVQEELGHTASGPDFGPILEALLAELAAAPPERFVVRAPEAHVERCGTWLEQHGFPQGRVETTPGLNDGVVLSDLAGTFRVTNSLATRFERLRTEARRICLARLYGETA